MTTEYTVTVHNKPITVDGKEVGDKIQTAMDNAIKNIHVDPNAFLREMQYLYMDGIKRGLQLAGINANYTMIDKSKGEISELD